MDHKKRNLDHKPFESFIQEIASESLLKAPPPTPSLPIKAKAGSAPDIRLADFLQKDKLSLNGIINRNVNHAIFCNRKLVVKSFFECEGKRSSSDHGLTTGNSKFSQWLVINQRPATSNVLHSVRQKLLNL